MGAAARYRSVLGRPHVARVVGSAQVARMATGIYGLALILFVREHTGTYAAAGAVTAAFVLGNGVGSPFQGRLIDRRGHAPVMVPLTLIHASCVALLAVLVLAEAPVWSMVAAALASGLALPPIGAVVRPLWTPLMAGAEELLPAAFALDSVLVELSFVVGPLLTAIAVSVADPLAALVLAAVLQVSGTFAFVTSEASRRWQPHPDRPHLGLLGALRSPGMQTLVATALPAGICVGMVEVGVPAFADAVGSRAQAGLLLSVWSLASAAGGLVYGARPPACGLGRAYPMLTALLVAGTAPLLAATSIPVMALLMIPAGMAIAPMLTTGNQLVLSIAPPGAVTEGYTWTITALVGGIAGGNALAGALASGPGWRSAFAVATGVGLLAVAVAVARRRTLLDEARAG